MYFAKGVKDLLLETRVDLEFFDELDEFTIAYITSFFQQTIDENMGLLTEVQFHNYETFIDFLDLAGFPIPEDFSQAS